jgi:hypothetical protein
MKCLSSAQIQAVVDGEAPQIEREHAQACEACATGVAARQADMALLRTAANGAQMPPAVAQRIAASISGEGATGATRLREQTTTAGWRRPMWGTAALVAATLVAVVFVAPMLKQDRGAVSASEVLAASANRLAQPVTGGVEFLEYELVLEGMPRDAMPEHQNGTYRVRQAIDHDTAGRFRFASFAPDGSPLSSIAQDPATHRRVMMVVHEGQPYRFEITVPDNVGPSIVEMERLHLQATIAMMQASGDQLLEVVETPEGKQYRINVPKVQTPIVNPVWDISEARVQIDATDYRVTEFAVKGTFLKQPYSIHYRLLSRHVGANVAPDTFEVPSVPGEIVMAGQGSVLPARDAMVLALRELARLKQVAQ